MAHLIAVSRMPEQQEQPMFIDFRQLREELDIQDVLALLNWEPVVHDRNGWRGPCPVHRSSSCTSRIFSVNLDRHIFKCFKCGAEGNALDLFAQAERLSIYAAAVKLSQELLIELPRKTR